MRTMFVVIVSLWLASSHGISQVILRAGSSYSYQFTTLAFQRNTSSGIPGPSGTVFLYVDPPSPSSLGPTNSYKVEMFEDTPGQTPFLTRTITAASSIYDTDYRTPGVWGDLQGSIRVTALTGSITLAGFSFQVVKTGHPTGFDIYGTDRIFLPAPQVLSIHSSVSNLVLSWPAAGTNFMPEAASILAAPVAWSPVTNTIVLSGGMLSVIIDATEAKRFFRLRWTGP